MHTNLYFDTQHHNLLDNVESYLSRTESVGKKRKRESEAPSSYKRLCPVAPTAPAVTTTHSVRREVKRSLPLNKKATAIMEKWYENNQEHPYPSYDTAQSMAQSGGITSEQVKKWFSNRRLRKRNTKSWKLITERRQITKNSISEVFIQSDLGGRVWA